MLIPVGILVVVLVCAVILWKVLFKPLIGYDKYLSINVREEISENIQSSHNSLTALAAAAIVLTFSVLEIFSKSSIEGIPFIISTWIMFMLCVLFGMGIGISTYVEQAISKVMINGLVSADKKYKSQKKITKEEEDRLDYTLKKQYQLLKMRFWLLYSQSVAFASGTLFLTIFAIINTCKHLKMA